MNEEVRSIANHYLEQLHLGDSQPLEALLEAHPPHVDELRELLDGATASHPLIERWHGPAERARFFSKLGTILEEVRQPQLPTVGEAVQAAATPAPLPASIVEQLKRDSTPLDNLDSGTARARLLQRYGGEAVSKSRVLVAALNWLNSTIAQYIAAGALRHGPVFARRDDCADEGDPPRE